MFTINKGCSNSKINSSLLCFTIWVLLLFYFTTTAQPAAPTNLTATRVSKSQIIITWKDNSSNETGFKIERAVGDSSFRQIKTRSANSKSYNDTGLTRGTIYSYRVRAYNSQNSTYSDTITLSTGPQFYVDNSASSNGSGTISSPWNNLRFVNNFNLPNGFVAGDTIYLKRGTGKDYTVATLVNRGPDQAGRNLFGVFSPRGKGNSFAPITLDAYDTGSTPIINAKGNANSAGILLYDQEYWTISNMEVINSATTDDFRYGILVYFQPQVTDTVYRNICIRKNNVHDICGSRFFNGPPNKFYTGCIYVWVAPSPTATTANSRLSNVLIEGNTVTNSKAIGIMFRGQGKYDSNPTAMNWNNLSIGVVIQDNFVQNVLDGIHWIGTDNAVVQRNRVDLAGNTGIYGSNKTKQTCAIAAIWPTCTRAGLVQYNEVSNTLVLPGDGYAFDADEVLDGTCYYQYNYSHDNQGGFFEEMPPDTGFDGTNSPKSVVRYNISQNDGQGIIDGDFDATFFLLRGNAEIYNNTIYGNRQIRFISNRSSVSNSCYNNIFYAPSADWNVNNNLHMTFNNNGYFNGLIPPITTATQIKDIKKITGNPLFVGPVGGGSSNRTSVKCYNLKYGSPCLKSGQIINNNGGYDFWGTVIPRTTLPSIGAYQMQ